MARKKVLIITYYWPPSGGSGVQRWVKFTKYLRNFGWEPIIYTPSNPEFPVYDDSLAKDIPKDIEVLRTPIWEPYSFYKKFLGLKPESRIGAGLTMEEKHNSFLQAVSVWIRGNFFIPDARKFWIKPSVKFLNRYLSEHPVDAIVTNGTPHSLHLIGLKLKQKTGLPWLADFRDPWTNIDFFEDLRLTRRARKKHHTLEKIVLETADVVTVTTPGTKRDFEKLADSNVHVITNGFDEDDFKEISVEPDEKFTISHIGVLTPSRNHPFLWDTFRELMKENESFARDFKLRLIGNVDISIRKEIIRQGLEKHVEFVNYIPHEQIIIEEKKSHVLLLIIRNAPNANTILPGKIFEYIAARRPVIAIGPAESDTASLLRENKCGATFSSEHKEQLKKEILRLYAAYTTHADTALHPEHIQNYTRYNLTERLAKLLDHISV